MPGYENAVDFISNIGFPIVVSLYLLYRMEQRVEELERTIQELASSLAGAKSNGKE
ncbi:MAG: YvrJ family protein [Lysinibacillus sp.]